MAKQKTEKSRFTSKYTDGYISDSQYLAEFMCERIAVKNKQSLSIKFWNQPDWRKTFNHQVTKAATLLQENTVMEILTALKGSKGVRILSLGQLKDVRFALEFEKKKNALVEEKVIGQTDGSKAPVAPRSSRSNLIKDLS